MRFTRFDGIKIKSLLQIKAMKEAGRLSAEALAAVGLLIAPGISTAELDRCAEDTIIAGGGIPAFKGYSGFPATICSSINEMVVHGIPSKNTILKDGDIVSIDTGAILNGWVGDNAATFIVGNVDPVKRRLVEVTKQAMWAGINQARAGNCLGDIGYAVQKVIESAGFGVIRDYAGHGIGRKMHEPPAVFNYGQPGEGLQLKPGMVLAIEPMATVGSFHVRVLDDKWGVVTCDRKPAAHFEHTVAITNEDPLILTQL